MYNKKTINITHITNNTVIGHVTYTYNDLTVDEICSNMFGRIISKEFPIPEGERIIYEYPKNDATIDVIDIAKNSYNTLIMEWGVKSIIKTELNTIC